MLMTGIDSREARDSRAETAEGDRPICEVIMRGEDAFKSASAILATAKVCRGVVRFQIR